MLSFAGADRSIALGPASPTHVRNERYLPFPLLRRGRRRRGDRRGMHVKKCNRGFRALRFDVSKRSVPDGKMSASCAIPASLAELVNSPRERDKCGRETRSRISSYNLQDSLPATSLCTSVA